MRLFIRAIIATGVAGCAITGYGLLTATGFTPAGVLAGEKSLYFFYKIF